jgi:formate dehydrogenase subunit gamma
MFLRFWRSNLWRREDATWMMHLRDVMTGHEERLPEIGKYNAGQKVVFWLMAILILVLIVSGVALWDQYFAQYTNVELKRIAVLIHAITAIVVISVLIVHVYAAIWVRGSFHAMIRGSVSGGWAWRHHRKWLRALVAKRRDDEAGEAKPAE